MILKFEVKSNMFRNLKLPFAFMKLILSFALRFHSVVKINNCLTLTKNTYASDRKKIKIWICIVSMRDIGFGVRY